MSFGNDANSPSMRERGISTNWRETSAGEIALVGTRGESRVPIPFIHSLAGGPTAITLQ